MKKIINKLIPILLAFALMFVLGAGISAETVQQTDVIEISSVEELMAINQNLSGHYVLTVDIDLAGQEWMPIGTYAPSGESEEEQEIPSADYAFTGIFDGQGHTISNLAIHQPEGWALGLFGCIANAEIGNFTLENAAVDGSVMAADVVGYTYCSTISNVKLTGGKVNVYYTEMSAEGMYGGIAGAGNGSLITQLSMIPAAVAYMLIIPGETGSHPFDTAEAETEICEGPLIEYSGGALGMFKLNTAMKMFIMTALFADLFFGGIETGIVALDAVIMVAVCAVVTFLSISLIHAVPARLKIEHLFKFYWTIVAGLAALSLILVWVGL